jgi:hypothetical protein
MRQTHSSNQVRQILLLIGQKSSIMIDSALYIMEWIYVNRYMSLDNENNRGYRLK